MILLIDLHFPRTTSTLNNIFIFRLKLSQIHLGPFSLHMKHCHILQSLTQETFSQPSTTVLTNVDICNIASDGI